MSRPIQARIDLAALRQNYLVAKECVSFSTKQPRAWAVIKANAYGHGLMRVAKALEEVADGFALLDLSDALMLREAGVRQPILLLEGFFSAGDLEACAEYGVIPAVHRVEQLQMIREAALPIRLPIYLKLNTGMNRLGFSLDEIARVRNELVQSTSIGEITLMSHFAEADGGRGIEWQLARFEAIRACWPESRAFPVCMANSAAILRHPQTAHDWVRPGIMLYGGSPLHDIRPGERVGYGGTFVAEQSTRVGVVACGYGDGYPRHAPTGTPILVNGHRTRTLGRVSMDMLVCDLTHLPEAGVGSPVVLWGQGLPAEEVAAAAGTICYELFCALAPRVPVIEV
jgi:alanine racemase